MSKRQHARRLTAALLETADDMRDSGVLGEAAHRKITLRHLGSANAHKPPFSGAELRTARERARMS